MSLAGSGQWTTAPCVHEEVQLEPVPHPTPNASSLGLAVAAWCALLLPGKFHPTLAVGWTAPRCPAASASGCSLLTGVLCRAAKALTNAAPDGELWWAHRSAAAKPHMPKEITFCYYRQRPRLKLCSENKSEVFFPITEFWRWTLSTAHTVLWMVRSMCVIATDRWVWAQVPKPHSADSPASQTLQIPIFSQHQLLPAVSNTSTYDLSPMLVETSKCFAAFTAAGWLCPFPCYSCSNNSQWTQGEK